MTRDAPAPHFLTKHEAARVAMGLLRRALADMWLPGDDGRLENGLTIFDMQLAVVDDWVNTHEMLTLGPHG